MSPSHPKPRSRPMTVYCPDDLAVELGRVARARDLSVSAAARRAFRDWIDKQQPDAGEEASP